MSVFVRKCQSLKTEGVGFEPTVQFPTLRFSRPVPSTAQSSLHTAVKMPRAYVYIITVAQKCNGASRQHQVALSPLCAKTKKIIESKMNAPGGS